MGESCSSKHTYYSDFQDIDEQGWVTKNPLIFTPASDKPIDPDAHMILSLRHDNFYKYRNLWLFIDYIDNSGKIKRDTVECSLADVYGKWYSKGFGSTYEFSTPLNSGVDIRKLKRIVVWQGMREDTIGNIRELGISIVNDSN